MSVDRTGAWARLRLWRHRNPVVASLSLFLAVSLLTGSAVSMLFGLTANREADRANREAKRANAKRDLHDFAWHYWDRLCHSHLLKLQGHSNSVASVVISPDWKRLASASAGHPGSSH